MHWTKGGIGWSVGLGFANIFSFYFIGGYCLGHKEWFNDRISILPKILLSLIFTTFILALVIKKTNISFDIIACTSPLMSICIFLIFKTIGQKKSIFSVDISTKVNFLANQTYSIYLMHIIILDWVMFVLERVKMSDIIGLWISIPLAVGLTYAISIFLMICLRGFVREGKWLTWLFP
jgi:peptidoglycan/LPS O-acetylase OafA/YrhL